MNSYVDLEAWKVGLDLVGEIYRLVQNFPATEIYGMTSQLKKSSTSVLANFAEGNGRFTYADKANKYVIARGECSETEAFLRIAVRLGFLEQSAIHNALQLIERERKLLSGLIQSAKEKV